MKHRFLICFVVSVSLAPASAAADDIDSTIAGGICPTAKIDDRGLPDLQSCKVYEPDWFKISACQDDATRHWNKVLKYNKLYDGCHASAGGDAAAADPPPRDDILRRTTGATARLESAEEKARHQRDDFEREAASPERREQVKAALLEQQRRNEEAKEKWVKMLLAAKEAKERRDADAARRQQAEMQAKEDAAKRAEQDRQDAFAKCDSDYKEERAACGPSGATRVWQNNQWTLLKQPGWQCGQAAGERLRACKQALKTVEERIEECDEGYENRLATCRGNTSQYRKENFVPSWVQLEGRTCLTSASLQRRLCEAIARGEPQSEIEPLSRAVASSESLHDRLNKTYGDWLPQEADSDPGPSYVPSFGPTYQGQSPQMQAAPNRPRPTVAPTPQRPSGGDSTTTSNYRGGGGAAPYVPPPQPRFVSPGAVR